MAGDEIPGATQQSVIATGYYQLGPWDDDTLDASQRRFDQLVDLLNTTSQVFVGLTLACARCHDHKFDPLTAKDYYNMLAVFGTLAAANGDSSMLLGTPAQRHARSVADRQISGWKDKIRELQTPLCKGLLSSGESELPADVVQAFLTAPNERNEVQNQLVQEHLEKFHGTVAKAAANKEHAKKYLSAEARHEVARLEQQVRELRDTHELPQGYFIRETSPNAPTMHVMKRGHPHLPGAVVGNNVTLKNSVCAWDGIRIEDDVFVGPYAAFINDQFPRSPRMPEVRQRFSFPDNWFEVTHVRQVSAIATALRCSGCRKPHAVRGHQSVISRLPAAAGGTS